MVQEFGRIQPLVIGVFCGPSKPTSIREFLKHFVDEIKSTLKLSFEFELSFEFDGSHYIVKSGEFICDAPARVFVKCIKGHSRYNSCECCTQEGVYVDWKNDISRI